MQQKRVQMYVLAFILRLKGFSLVRSMQVKLAATEAKVALILKHTHTHMQTFKANAHVIVTSIVRASVYPSR